MAQTPPDPGMTAPMFSLPDTDGRERRLTDWQGRWLVLYFYPKDDTPGCTTEAVGFRDALPRLAALNAEVVGISLDDGPSHRAFSDKHRLPFPLLVDAGGKVARRFGALSDFGLFKFAKRHTFLIDPAGRVAKSYLKVDAEKHVEEIIADLERLR